MWQRWEPDSSNGQGDMCWHGVNIIPVGEQRLSAPKGHRQFLRNNKKKVELVAQVVGECDGESRERGLGRGVRILQ